MDQHWKATGDLPPRDELARVTTLLTDVLDAEGTSGPQQVYILANALAACAVAVGGADPKARAETAIMARTLLETRLKAATDAAKAYR